jgi:putative zinc finger protein
MKYDEMTCNEIKSRLSSYLDTALPGADMQAVRAHLSGCGDCHAEHRQLEQARDLVAGLGPRRAPADLALRIRVALAQERAARSRHAWQAFALRTQESLRAFMLPATAGLVSAIVFFGLLIGFWAMPAISNDVPIPSFSYTPPQLTAMPSDSVDGASEPIMVETFIDENGRVQDYRILTQGLDTKAIQPQLDSIMIFTQFQPARAFGRPISGRAVISFSNVHVGG